MRMLSNTEAELKKRVSYKKSKKACNKVTMPSIVGHAYINIYIYIYIYIYDKHHKKQLYVMHENQKYTHRKK